MGKDSPIIQRTITIVLVVSLLFTAGFVLGAVTAEIKELAPVVEQVTETTTTTAPPTTEVPTTLAPTTTEPTTTETTTMAPTTTEPTTESTTESTTAAPEETPEDEPCCLVKIALTILDIIKKIIDFIISILSSL